jgi:peptidoglycan/LPS O-acetylase OafA/YrhL
MRKMPDQVQGVQVAAAVGVSMTIAILLSYLIEKPSLRYLRRKWAAHTMK